MSEKPFTPLKLNAEDTRMMSNLSKNSMTAFYYWRGCVNAGAWVKLKIVDGSPVPFGYCKKKGYDIDFEYQCLDCKDHKEQRGHPKHEKTPIKKLRIARGRARTIKKQAESLKAGVASKTIDEYGQEDPKGSVRSNHGAIDPGKKSKSTNKTRE